MGEGLSYQRHYTKGLEGNVYGGFEWEKQDVAITDDGGGIRFVQKDVEFPKSWGPLARKVTASKYFYGQKDTSEREYSAKQLSDRVSSTMAEWALKQGYFSSQEEADAFREELSYMHLDQRMAFNSPVWFNVGANKIAGDGSNEQKRAYIIGSDGEPILLPLGKERAYPQTAACFIQSVGDHMEDIMELAVNEALLFKYGSGTGTNLSSLRSSREFLSGGGKPSGPLAYWAFYDKVAGIVKSGGKTRRAAKMDILNVDHPDIMEFIESKANEERKMHILMDNGISYLDAHSSVNYQNTNISVRVTDEFLEAVDKGKMWQTVPVHSRELLDKMPRYKAKEIMRKIAEAAYKSGDPGMQYDTTINDWHTTPNTARINASNPCSEYMQIDDTSCNLASIRLTKFLNSNGEFDIEGYGHAIRTIAIAQDLEVDASSYPTERIARNTHRLRNLGQGYADLGSLLMFLGIAYDSPEARATAAAITAFQTGKVYETSTEIAEKIGTFKEFDKNKEPMMRVMRKHRDALKDIDRSKIPKGLEHILDEAENIWENVIERGEKYGFRNAQATVIAPTGTIGFMMDCDTLGVEPEIGLVQTKQLYDGGILRRVNGTVKPALERLGYDSIKINNIITYVVGHGTPEGAPHIKEGDKELFTKDKHSKVVVEELKNRGYTQEQCEEISHYVFGHESMEGAPDIKEEHLAIFDTANKKKKAKRSISPMGHLEMMAAVQPFVSGAISKTVNLPGETSVEEIEGIYLKAGKMGIKSVALYRDGSKEYQPLSFSEGDSEKQAKPVRHKLPVTRHSITHKFSILEHEGYLHVGLYPETNKPGEVFIEMSKEGSTIGGLMDAYATSISLNLQYGVPLEDLVRKFRHQKFEPRGLVTEGDPDIKTADSIVDYIFNFLDRQFNVNSSNNNIPEKTIQRTPTKKNRKISEENIGGLCGVCGNQMERKGHCEEVCATCGHLDQKGCGQ